MATSESPSLSADQTLEKPARSPAQPTPAISSLLPPSDQDSDQEQPPGFRHASGFFNQPWVQNVLPLATSLALHVGIIVLGIVLYQAVKEVTNPNKDQVIIPESKSIEKNAMPGGIEHPGLNSDKTRDAAQDAIKNSDDSGFAASVSNNLAAAAGGGMGSEESSGFEGANTSSGKGNNGSGGAGSAFGSGSGGGTAPWGVPGGGGGLLPKSNFLGVGGNATKVIYLCDASGSMLSVFNALKKNLKESINQLDVTQQFNVIFFSDDNVFPLFKDGMHIAGPDNKKNAMEFIDNAVSTGGTVPLPAINFALKERPELLYVLTDGFDNVASFDDVVNAFKLGNPDGKMHINCIFLQSDPDPKLEEILKQIAKTANGQFNKILKSDM
jgi:hypothetical protein